MDDDYDHNPERLAALVEHQAALLKDAQTLGLKTLAGRRRVALRQLRRRLEALSKEKTP
jgi:hypothetical protein